MSEKPVKNGRPSWFDEIDIDALVDQLDPLLHEMLGEQLSGELGEEIAARMKVIQIDSYQESHSEPPGEAMSEITRRLNEELWRILIDDYGVPEEEAKLALVRRWGLLAAVRNPDCKWFDCWVAATQSWCLWKGCCPCA